MVAQGYNPALGRLTPKGHHEEEANLDQMIYYRLAWSTVRHYLKQRNNLKIF